MLISSRGDLLDPARWMSLDLIPSSTQQKLDPAAEEELRPYVTSLTQPVYCLRNLPEEVVAVLFAYYSRSEGNLRENLLRLLREESLLCELQNPANSEERLSYAGDRAREFHEKWVVGYGHSSVAEHAVAHIAVEDVSILASKVIEDSRLASYTEKSTRYVPFPRAAYVPGELTGQDRTLYLSAVETLFDSYTGMLDRLTRRMGDLLPREQFKTERGWRNGCRAQACDLLRGLLPAAALTNLGLTANARVLEAMIGRLLSHPLAEARAVGESMKDQVRHVIPTLIKYARPSEYRRQTPALIRGIADRIELTPQAEPEAAVRLVAAPADAELRLAAAILYEASSSSYGEVLSRLQLAGEELQRQVIGAYLQGRRRHGSAEHGYTDPPLRHLEHLYFSFEIVVDYGAYRDIQRHRMATQADQLLGCDLGYEVPELLSECGMAAEFRQALDSAARSWRRLLPAGPVTAQYLAPLAYRKRMLITWNLRELHHFISLRSGRQGHISYRRIAQQAYRVLAAAQPYLAQFIQVDLEDYAVTRPG